MVVIVNKLFTKIMTALSVMPDVSDIVYFLNGGSEKSKNDEHNKIRENVIAHMYNLDDEYFTDFQHGENWRTISNKFYEKIKTLCPENFENIKIKRKGGMSYNHDFVFTFLKNGTVVNERKVEFKHNNSNVSDLAQFLELYDKDCKNKYDLCTVSYSEYYYDNYLDQYINCDDEIIQPKPDKDTYLNNVHDIKYKHPFFKNLHETKNNKKKEKKAVADESRQKYIETYSKIFKFSKLEEKIKESQKDKVFLLWDCKDFHIQILDTESFKITEIKNINDLYFDLTLEKFDYDIRVRLNWGNSVGLANPRWKFSFVNKEKYTD